jgi:CARDB protein
MKKELTIPGLRTILLTSFLLSSLFVQPTSQASRVASLAPPSPPDITSQHGITIGGAIGGAGGHFSPWGGTITLTAADAIVVSGGRCAFNVSYDMRNLGTTPTSPPFKNTLRLAGADVSIQSELSLAGGATRQIDTQAYLDTGTHVLSLNLDSDNVVAESNEANNIREVKVRVTCDALSDITSQRGITFGGGIGGVGGRFVPWGGSIVLTSSDALPVSAKRCAFNVTYDMENIGTGPTSPIFLNRLRFGSAVVAINSSLSLAAGGTRDITTQPSLNPGTQILSLSLDDDHVVHESNESNNLRRVKVRVNCP